MWIPELTWASLKNEPNCWPVSPRNLYVVQSPLGSSFDCSFPCGPAWFARHFKKLGCGCRVGLAKSSVQSATGFIPFLTHAEARRFFCNYRLLYLRSSFKIAPSAQSHFRAFKSYYNLARLAVLGTHRRNVKMTEGLHLCTKTGLPRSWLPFHYA